jgi:hypothetical protein
MGNTASIPMLRHSGYNLQLRCGLKGLSSALGNQGITKLIDAGELLFRFGNTVFPVAGSR